MAHVQLEFDAIGKAHAVAAILGLPPQHVTGGLCELWAFCWREKTDVASRVILEGVFGTSHPRLVEALVAFGFLEETPDGLRIRGAAKYLRIAENIEAGRRKGGLAARKNLRQGPGSPPAGSRLKPEDSPGSPRLLTPITEHRSPNTEEAKDSLSSTFVDSPAPEDQLVALWNETAAPELPRCQQLTDGRRKKARALLAVIPLERWPELIANGNASDFCRGLGSDFRLSLAWMLKSPENALKVLEGNYANAGHKVEPRRDRFQAAPPEPPRKTTEELLAEGAKAWTNG